MYVIMYARICIKIGHTITKLISSYETIAAPPHTEDLGQLTHNDTTQTPAQKWQQNDHIRLSHNLYEVADLRLLNGFCYLFQQRSKQSMDINLVTENFMMNLWIWYSAYD